MHRGRARRMRRRSRCARSSGGTPDFEPVARLVERLAVLTGAGIAPLSAWRYAAAEGAPAEAQRVVAGLDSAHELPDRLAEVALSVAVARAVGVGRAGGDLVDRDGSGRSTLGDAHPFRGGAARARPGGTRGRGRARRPDRDQPGRARAARRRSRPRRAAGLRRDRRPRDRAGGDLPGGGRHPDRGRRALESAADPRGARPRRDARSRLRAVRRRARRRRLDRPGAATGRCGVRRGRARSSR